LIGFLAAPQIFLVLVLRGFFFLSLTLACGGIAVNSVEDLTEDSLGFAGSVYEHVLVSAVFSCAL
jgi:hypothetical protein